MTLRHLPSVHAVLERPELADSIACLGRDVVADHLRTLLDAFRSAPIEPGRPGPSLEVILTALNQRIDADRPALRPVINATGILIHTGLGRSPLGPSITAHIAAVAAGYCNLEFDLATGQRGRRASAVTALLRELTGTESAAVVNNNAAATLLALRSLAAGREVIVSRGQLVEIGGSYRLPEVFEASGARLREVGTTNKTRLADYARGIGPETAGLLRVHPSNYRIVGFTEEVEIDHLAALAHERGLWCIDDIGSGALAPGLPPGVVDEPTIQQSLAAGADLVLCSGDKLLGGPQCGLILGRRELVERLTSDPMMRALRVDKLTLAALEALLRAARSPDRAFREIPLWHMLATPMHQLEHRARVIADTWTAMGAQSVATESTAYLGGGTTPVQPLPSWAVRLTPPFPGGSTSVDALATALRLDALPIVARVQTGSLWFDLRTLLDGQDDVLSQTVTTHLNAVS